MAFSTAGAMSCNAGQPEIPTASDIKYRTIPYYGATLDPTNPCLSMDGERVMVG